MSTQRRLLWTLGVAGPSELCRWSQGKQAFAAPDTGQSLAKGCPGQ